MDKDIRTKDTHWNKKLIAQDVDVMESRRYMVKQKGS